MYETRCHTRVNDFIVVAKTKYGIEFNVNAIDNKGRTPSQMPDPRQGYEEMMKMIGRPLPLNYHAPLN